jgi:hypothetical protein
MATAAKKAQSRGRTTLGGNRILGPKEARAVFDYRARKVMGMSGEEFLRRYDAGEYDEIADKPGHRHIMDLIALAPFGRQET